jgi:hypothetical protein
LAQCENNKTEIQVGGNRTTRQTDWSCRVACFSGLFYHIGQLERPQFSAVLWRCAVYAEIVVVDNDDRIAAHERQAFHLLVRIFESSQIRALAVGV